LLKWLLEIARQNFQTVIKERSDKLAYMAAKLTRGGGGTPIPFKGKAEFATESPQIQGKGRIFQHGMRKLMPYEDKHNTDIFYEFPSI
jgi:hypothetical protein